MDDKIECNQRICRNLEEQAQALFKHWFIDFTPFRNTPFIDSPLGPIPSGWRVGTLGEVMIENPKSRVQVNRATQQGIYPFFTSGTKILRYNEYLVSGCNIFLNTGGNADVKYYIGKTSYSTDTWCVRGIDYFTDFLYLYLRRNIKMVNNQYFEGSALKHLQKKDLKNHVLLIPPQDVVRRFDTLCHNYFQTIGSLNQESIRLATLRDTLLPKLMSGEIKG